MLVEGCARGPARISGYAAWSDLILSKELYSRVVELGHGYEYIVKQRLIDSDSDIGSLRSRYRAAGFRTPSNSPALYLSPGTQIDFIATES